MLFVTYGLVNSAYLALISIGMSLTFGVSGMANFAYGALYVLGGLAVWSFVVALGLPYIVSIVLAIVVMALLGYLMYWVLIYRVRGMLLNEVIITFSVGVGLLELLRWAGVRGHEQVLPAFVKGGLDVFGVGIDYQRIFIIGSVAVLITFLYFLTHYTKIGLSFRGIAQEEQTAISLGIESDKVAAYSLAIGTALVTIAAAVALPLTTINVDVGYEVLIYALGIGLVGGWGNIIGIVLASLILGFSQAVMAVYFASEWSITVMLIAILVVLAVKPSGILGQSKELEERV